jgi:putative efflux protein, MATE family
MDNTEAMATRPVGQLLAEFSLPAIGGLLVSSLYNLVDRIFIGQGTGVNGMAAVTAAWPIMIASLAIGVLFQNGARTLAAVSMGQGDLDKAEKYMARATGAAFIFAAIFAGICWLLVEPLLKAFGANGEVMLEAKAYTGWILLSAPGQAAAMTIGSALAAEGRPKSAFMVQIAGTFINAALAPIFIFALHWGVGGAGLAVAISQTLGLVLTCVYVYDKRGTIRPKIRYLLPEHKMLGELSAVGAPFALMQLVTCATFVVANIAVKPYGGELGLAAIGVIVTVVQFLGFPLFGIIQGAQPLWGYNYGAAKWERVRRISLLALVWTIGFAAVSECAMVFFPGIFVGLFSGDPRLADIGAHSLRIFALSFVLLPLELGPASYFQATGRAGPGSFVLILRALSFIAGMAIFPIFWGYDGILWAEVFSDSLTCCFGLVYGRRMLHELKNKVACAAEA